MLINTVKYTLTLPLDGGSIAQVWTAVATIIGTFGLLTGAMSDSS